MKIKRLLAAGALATGLVTATALSASATTGGEVHNRTQNILIYISAYNPYSQPYAMQPGFDSVTFMPNVQCFKPQYTVRSQYGGLYTGGVVRCMSGNNIKLWFYNP